MRGIVKHRIRRLFGLVAAPFILAFVLPIATAQAAPNFQLPFPCGQTWVGSTWDGHSPANAVDLNRGPNPDSDLGDTVVASYGGTVKTSTYSTTTGYGNYIVIDHGGGWETLYAHLNSRSVSAGQSVKIGQKIGTVGNTSAKYNLAPHLHYEQRYGGTVKKIVWNGVAIPYYAKQSYTSHNACSSGTASGTVNTSGANLNVRSGPSTTYSIVGSLADGAQVTIYCQIAGQSVTGTYGTSNLWNRIGTGRYIPDVYTYTGSDGRVAPDC
ncbi:M23 family metallopeptidase [Luteimonas panaciterrae]|uniref:M23 family metallopeptidase n=1 Tax=Luteimonas panaciterrae TaxID=363885 RepID=UPI001CFBC01C|nr:M23 family metallopeptidase [Luteimonas panaciterrae]